MRLPNLTAADNLPLTLPPIKDNQAWAFNQDTSPPSLVLVEFVYSVDTTISAASQDSLNLLNTTVNQTITSLSTVNLELQNLSSRLSNIENFLNITNFNVNAQGTLLPESNVS